MMEFDAKSHDGEWPRDDKMSRTNHARIPLGMYAWSHAVGCITLVLQVEKLHANNTSHPRANKVQDGRLLAQQEETG